MSCDVGELTERLENELRTMFWCTRSLIPGSPTSATAITRASRSCSDSTEVSARLLVVVPHEELEYEIPVESEDDLPARFKAASDIGLY